MRRNPVRAATARSSRQQWQIDQAARCACRGSDDLCACQNVEEPWKYGLGGKPPPTREQELERRVRELEGTVRSLELQQQTDRQTIAHLLAARERSDTGRRDRSNGQVPGTQNPSPPGDPQ